MSETFDPSAGQPLPTTSANSQDVAVEVVKNLRNDGLESMAQDVEARIALGERKYGSRLKTFNGRDALKDLYDELLDALNYAKQLDLEGKEIGWVYDDIYEIATEVAAVLKKV